MAPNHFMSRSRGCGRPIRPPAIRGWLPGLTALVLLVIPAVAFSASPPPAPQQKEPTYITKTYVDTMIQQAFFRFNAAAAITGAVYQQQQAIAAARQTAATLKQIAQQDPNRRYILWRVSELEHQIFLEEQELVHKKREKDQKIINGLIDQFNAEVGKRRPNFAVLASVKTRMTAVDEAKADEITAAMADRQRSISRELLIAIEKSLISGDFITAQKELNYCATNDGYLSIPTEKLRLAESQVQSRIDGDKVKKIIRENLDKASRHLAEHRYLHARTALQGIEEQLAGIKAGMPAGEWSDAQNKSICLQRLIEAQEDSLVAVNLSLLQQAGLDAAIDYMEFTLRRCEVLPEKIARVDAAIRATPLSRGGEEADDEEISGLGPDEGANDGSLSLFAVQAAVQKRAQARADSLRKIEEAQARIDAERRKKELAREERESRRKAKQLAREQRQRDKEAARQQRLAQREAQKAQQARRPAAATPRLDSAGAKQKMLEIYTLLEANAITEAYELFTSLEQALQGNIHGDVFMMLKYTVSDAHAAFAREGEAGASPSTEVVLVEKTVAPVAPAAQSTTAGAQNNEAIALQKMTFIYKLLEQNEVARAYDTFQKLRPRLQQYLSADLFEMLLVTVDQSYLDFARPASRQSPASGL